MTGAESQGQHMDKILAELAEKSGESLAQQPESEVATLLTETLGGEKKALDESEQHVYKEAEKASITLLTPSDPYPDQTRPLRTQVGNLMRSDQMQRLTQYHDATAATFAHAWFEQLKSATLIPGAQAVADFMYARGVATQDNVPDILRILRDATTLGVYDHSSVVPALLPVLAQLRADSPEDFPTEAAKLHDVVIHLVETAGACHVWTPLSPPPDEVMSNIPNIYKRRYDAVSTVFALPHRRLPQEGTALLEPVLAIALQ